MVEMLRLALSRRMRSIQRPASFCVMRSSFSRPRAACLSIRRTRSCISWAAALVKVMAMMLRQSAASPAIWHPWVSAKGSSAKDASGEEMFPDLLQEERVSRKDLVSV